MAKTMATTDTMQGQAQAQAAREGALRRAWRWLVGTHPRLREDEGKTSWLSYLLMIVQSLTLVLIGGSVELRTLLSGAPLPEKALMTLSLAVLVLGTYAADMCAQRTMGRVGVLWRNRRSLMASEHILYVAFVVGVEMATYAVALYIIETNPQALLSGVSLLPTTLLVIGVMVGIRALIIAWTYVQLKIIAEPLPANELTLMRRGVEKVGGHADALLDGMQLQTRDVAAALNAIAEMSKPPRRAPTWYNGWLRARDAQIEQEQDALRQRQIEALRALSRDEVAEAHTQAARDVAAARAEAQRQIATEQERVRHLTETAQRQIGEANAHATQRASDALLSLLAGGSLPDWLTAAHPELAGVTLDTLTAGRRSGSGRSNGGGMSGVASASETVKAAGRQRAFLSAQGIETRKTPEGKRGVWLTAADVSALTSGRESASESHQALVRRLGAGAKSGVALVAPFEPVLRELAERRLLTDEAAQWWSGYQQAQQAAAQGVSSDTGEHAAALLPFSRRA